MIHAGTRNVSEEKPEGEQPGSLVQCTGYRIQNTDYSVQVQIAEC